MMKRLKISALLFIATLQTLFSQTDTTGIVESWKLVGDFTTSETVVIDTNLPGFQIYYPNYIYSRANSSTGTFGAPNISLILSDRLELKDDFIFLNSYLPYLSTAENSYYYNTRKPFSQLNYIYGKPNVFREQAFELLHSQNINPRLNFALLYKNITTRSQFKYANLKKHAFQITSNYSGERYVANGAINLTRYWNDENGGVIDSVFESNTIDYTTNIPTRISGVQKGTQTYVSNARNRIRYLDVLIAQRFKLFTIASTLDTTQVEKGRNLAEPILSYVVRAKRGTKTYVDSDPTGSGLYDKYYFNASETQDSTASFKLSNQLRLDFKTTFRSKVQVDIYGALGHEYEMHHFYSLFDTMYNPLDDTLVAADTLITPWITNNNVDTLKGINRSRHLTSTYFSAGIYGNFWSRVKLNVGGKLYFIGEKSGDTELNGLLSTRLSIFKRDFNFDVAAELKNKKPSYLLQNYYSNHYIWTSEQRELENEILTSLSGKISTPSNGFELTGKYYLFSDLIYFNEQAVPENYGNALNILTVELRKTFKLWELYSENAIIYQASENMSVLPLPDLVVFNSTYLNHTFHFKSTGGKLQTIIGFDVYYTTDYYGYEYSPALSQFYIQNSKYIGNFPLMDAYLNIKLKRLRFFLKMQHLNSLLFDRNYYAAIHYPHTQADFYGNPSAFQVGFSWVFYD